MVISKAVCVVYGKGRSTYALNEKNLRSVLDVDDVRDRKIVVVSLVGASRIGKSVLANFFLRYLESKYGSQNHTTAIDDASWMENDADRPLLGFPWSVSAGIKPVTKGIWMSSTAYLTNQNNEKVAIVLLDCQGIFDSYSTNKDWTTLLAFTGLVSSVTCYNVMNDMQPAELNSLLFFCEYGKLAVQRSGQRSKPMQNLMFVIRDWQQTRKYGAKEGAEHLAYKMEFRDDFKILVDTHFNDISCFLLPFPGLRIEEQDYHGSIDQLSPLYKEHLQGLVRLLFDTENLVLKEINGERVTSEQLIEFFKVYIVMLQREGLPEPKSLFLLTAEGDNRAAMRAAKTKYNTEMRKNIKRADPGPMTEQEFLQEHERIKKMVLEEFDVKPKMGGKSTSESYRLELEADLYKLYRQLKVEKKRREASPWRTYMLGATTLAAAIALEVILARWKWHRVLDLVFNLTCKWALLGVLTWSYISHRGLWD